MTLKSDAKFEEKLIYYVKNEKKIGEFWPEHSKFSKLLLSLVPFVQSI